MCNELPRIFLFPLITAIHNNVSYHGVCRFCHGRLQDYIYSIAVQGQTQYEADTMHTCSREIGCVGVQIKVTCWHFALAIIVINMYI